MLLLLQQVICCVASAVWQHRQQQLLFTWSLACISRRLSAAALLDDYYCYEMKLLCRLLCSLRRYLMCIQSCFDRRWFATFHSLASSDFNLKPNVFCAGLRLKRRRQRQVCTLRGGNLCKSNSLTNNLQCLFFSVSFVANASFFSAAAAEGKLR